MVDYLQYSTEKITITRDLAFQLDSGETLSSAVSRWYPDNLINYGDATTEYTISSGGGNQWVYTWTGTGTDPGIDSALSFAVGMPISVNGENFSAVNNGNFIISRYANGVFEVTNASGTAEASKTVGSGFIAAPTMLAVVPTGYSYPFVVEPFIVIGTPSVSSTEYSVQISGGVVGTTYKIETTCPTTDSNILVDNFEILVR